MVETTYYKNKVYIPREIRESLGLVDGDRLYIEVLDRGVAQLILMREGGACRRVLERISNPPNLGRLKGWVTRRGFMKILLDNNVLVHAYNRASQLHKKLQILLGRLHVEKLRLALPLDTV